VEIVFYKDRINLGDLGDFIFMPTTVSTSSTLTLNIQNELELLQRFQHLEKGECLNLELEANSSLENLKKKFQQCYPNAFSWEENSLGPSKSLNVKITKNVPKEGCCGLCGGH